MNITEIQTHTIRSMDDNITFRLVNKNERHELELLLKEFVKEHEQYQEEDVDPDDVELDDDDSWIWNDTKNEIESGTSKRIFYPLGLFHNFDEGINEMIGFCILCNLSKSENLSNWIILEFSINQKLRNKGLGTKFANMVIDFCINKSIRNIKIEASNNINNIKAHKFWISLGFETIEKNVVFTDRTLYGVGTFHKNVYSKKKIP